MKKDSTITGRITITINGVEYAANIKLAPTEATNKTREYKAWGVRIKRHEKDPNSAVEYIGDAVGYTPATGSDPGSWADNPVYNKIKPCLLDGEGKVAMYLNPANFGQDHEGQTLGGLRGYFNTMIEFGKVYYRITQDDAYTYIEVTDDSKALADGFTDYAYSYKNNVRDAFYVGAYKGVVKGTKLRSITCEAPTGNMTIGQFRAAAQANGEGYEILPYNKLLLLQVLYIIRYKSLDSRAALGKGWTEASEYAKTGDTDTKGMYYGEPDGKTRVKFCGIEDFYGNLLEWVDGFITTDRILIANGYFNDRGEGYEHIADLPDDVYGIVTDIYGDNKLGFIPRTADEDMEPGEGYFRNYASTWRDERGYLPYFGGTRGNGADAGAFCFSCNVSASDAYASIGARLCFCGK